MIKRANDTRQFYVICPSPLAQGLRQFSVRRIAKVRTESQWVALTYDILQWIRLRWRPKMVSALAPT